jgi:FkbM family methyltransferase
MIRRGWRGSSRLYGLLNRLVSFPAVRARSRYGPVFALHPHDYIDRIVLREGYYESEVLEALRPYLGPGCVLWDVGANFGLHAVTAKKLAPETTVVALEPSPVMAGRVLANAAVNGVAVDVVCVGLWDGRGHAPLYCIDEGNPGMTTLVPWSGAKGYRRVSATVDTGEALVREGGVPAPTVVKIDVEGAEERVLRGMGALLGSTALRAVVFEAAADLVETGCPGGEARLLAAAGLGAFEKLPRRESTHHNLYNYLARRVDPARARP